MRRRDKQTAFTPSGIHAPLHALVANYRLSYFLIGMPLKIEYLDDDIIFACLKSLRHVRFAVFQHCHLNIALKAYSIK